MSNGLNKIIVISIKEKRVKKYYDVWDQQKDKIAKSIKVGARIYGVSANYFIHLKWNKEYTVSHTYCIYKHRNIKYTCLKVQKHAVCPRDCIFFIPFQMNEIIYIDRNTYETNYFEVDDENETEFTWLRNMRQNYIFQIFQGNYLLLSQYFRLSSRHILLYGTHLVQKMARLVEQCEEEIFVDSVDMDKMIFSLKVMTMDYGQEKFT